MDFNLEKALAGAGDMVHGRGSYEHRAPAVAPFCFGTKT